MERAGVSSALLFDMPVVMLVSFFFVCACVLSSSTCDDVCQMDERPL